MHVRAVDLGVAREDHRIRVKRAAEAAAPKQKLNNGGRHDATGSVPPLTAIADVWTIA
jgi:hypothetical protein